jgi:hypothetical protein
MARAIVSGPVNLSSLAIVHGDQPIFVRRHVESVLPLREPSFNLSLKTKDDDELICTQGWQWSVAPSHMFLFTFQTLCDAQICSDRCRRLSYLRRAISPSLPSRSFPPLKPCTPPHSRHRSDRKGFTVRSMAGGKKGRVSSPSMSVHNC